MSSILDFERSRNQRQHSKLLSRKVDFMRWFEVAFLANCVFIVTQDHTDFSIYWLVRRNGCYHLADNSFLF